MSDEDPCELETADAVKTPWVLRRAVRADLDGITALQFAAYAKNRDQLGVEPLPLLMDYHAALDRLEFWVAEVPADDAEDGAPEELAGVLMLDAADAFTIESIAVAPSRAGSGLGTALLQAAEIRARVLGYPRVCLYPGAPLTHLIAWYGRHGFEEDRVETLSDRSIVHMSKRVT
ncbi:MAG: GNAT family N-acetyltransferase [Pseudomonadota bacterium]